MRLHGSPTQSAWIQQRHLRKYVHRQAKLEYAIAHAIAASVVIISWVPCFILFYIYNQYKEDKDTEHMHIDIEEFLRKERVRWS